MFINESEDYYRVVREKHHKIANFLCAAALTLQMTPKVEELLQEDLEQLTEQIEFAIEQLKACQEAFEKITEESKQH